MMISKKATSWAEAEKPENWKMEKAEIVETSKEYPTDDPIGWAYTCYVLIETTDDDGVARRRRLWFTEDEFARIAEGMGYSRKTDQEAVEGVLLSTDPTVEQWQAFEDAQGVRDVENVAIAVVGHKAFIQAVGHKIEHLAKQSMARQIVNKVHEAINIGGVQL